MQRILYCTYTVLATLLLQSQTTCILSSDDHHHDLQPGIGSESEFNITWLYCAGCVDKSDRPKSLYDVPLVPPSHLVPTIYLSEPGVYTKLVGQVGRGGDTQDMVSVALRIKLDTFSNVKVSCSVHWWSV